MSEETTEIIIISVSFYPESDHVKPQSLSGQFSSGNDEALIEDLLSILKNEVGNKKNKNVDILSLSSQICLKLNGECGIGVSVVLVLSVLFTAKYKVETFYSLGQCKARSGRE